ncbi:MAG TPA: peptidoglycan editing factor PgeF [Candidatus Competibacter sp.]|nr:peptidoglycan editing factor PgeF [Candidatus Competibacteraceae bacterium]HRE55576.1 peptidoglycan editing factor PgeF [Candidatus Competibacter sp.]HUM95713.1 peptidoglycan editing factor PgeF [Candidatus Competibacter sp.]
MSELHFDDLILPGWPAPSWVLAASTTRRGGVSQPPYNSLNLASHVGDASLHVAENRRRLAAVAGYPSEPAWLQQVHGNSVVAAETVIDPVAADAAWTRRSGKPCVVMTADCLPILLCDRAGTVVAAVHAGWRGLANGVITATVQQMKVPPMELMAWLGPAIGPTAFEVGEEVRAAFLTLDRANTHFFQPSPDGRWLADIYGLARLQLRRLFVTAIYGGHSCTFRDAERFFSYRRDNHTGRMASLIWLA